MLVGLALAISALARPQQVFKQSVHRTDAIAIAMTVDISGSMNALDSRETILEPEVAEVLRPAPPVFLHVQFVDAATDGWI